MIKARSATAISDLAILLIAIGAVVAVGSIVLGPKPTIIAVALPAAAAATLYIIRRPLTVLIAMVVIEVTNLAGVLAERSPLPIFHISLGLGLLTIGVALRDPVMRRRVNRWTIFCVGLIACYLITQLLAALGSQNFEASMATLRNSVVDCVFLIVVLILAQVSEKPWAVAAAVVIPLALLSLLSLISQVGFGGATSFGGFATVTQASGQLTTTLRYGGPLPDSNFWGRHLILGLPLAGALTVRAVRTGRQRVALVWAGAGLALLVGVYLTQSRGTIISAALVLFVWIVASGPAARRVGLMSLPLAATVLLVPGIGDRLTALIADVSESGPQYGIDPSVLGRKAAQEIAWAMFRDRPMFGFGPGVYELSVPQYAGIVDTAVRAPADAAHNLYAQLAAESGIVGLVGWTVFVVGFIGCIGLRVVRFSRTPNGSQQSLSQRSLAAAVLAALIAWSIASIFLHLAYFRTFAIILALAGSLASSAVPNTDRGVRPIRVRARDVLLFTGFGVFAAAAVTLVTSVAATETYTASQKVTILPTQAMESGYAYALDIRSRHVVLPTYAAIMAASDPAVTAIGDYVRGAITISVTDTDKDSARARLDVALAEARRNLADTGADSWYTLSPIGEVDQSTVTSRKTGWTAGAVLATTALTAIGIALAVRKKVGSADRSGPDHTVGIP
ncbi:O-antigen ligase family protein [Rhodococcus sp. MS16]|uniref:O-antigen ligase family protein n=1 Tax=Rhodococcus sp. MS16 TaxID=2579941 RepID=UPI0015621E2A|nr:O-antigen ligase family protein [Rhodococcus sp. MS16]NRI66960.1 O-antigen ligase family protein [Rhodococcus sp. MS16]